MTADVLGEPPLQPPDLRAVLLELVGARTSLTEELAHAHATLDAQDQLIDRTAVRVVAAYTHAVTGTDVALVMWHSHRLRTIDLPGRRRTGQLAGLVPVSPVPAISPV